MAQTVDGGQPGTCVSVDVWAFGLWRRVCLCAPRARGGFGENAGRMEQLMVGVGLVHPNAPKPTFGPGWALLCGRAVRSCLVPGGGRRAYTHGPRRPRE